MTTIMHKAKESATEWDRKRERERDHRWFYRSFYGAKLHIQAKCNHENENKPKTIYLKLWMCGFIVGVVFVVSCWCCWTFTTATATAAVSVSVAVVVYVLIINQSFFASNIQNTHYNLLCHTESDWQARENLYVYISVCVCVQCM